MNAPNVLLMFRSPEEMRFPCANSFDEALKFFFDRFCGKLFFILLKCLGSPG